MGKIDPETRADWDDARRRMEAIVERGERLREEARQRAERRRLELQRLSFGLLGRQAPADPESGADSDDPRHRLQAIVDRLEREQEEARRRAERRRQRIQRLSVGLLGRQAQTENGQIA
jgi:hypothetical protein